MAAGGAPPTTSLKFLDPKNIPNSDILDHKSM